MLIRIQWNVKWIKQQALSRRGKPWYINSTSISIANNLINIQEKSWKWEWRKYNLIFLRSCKNARNVHGFCCKWNLLERSEQKHLVKCNYVKLFLLLFCKFFQGIDKMFFIFAARPRRVNREEEGEEVFWWWNILLYFPLRSQKYSKL